MADPRELLLQRIVDGELSADERARLARDPALAGEAAALQRIKRALPAAAPSPAPDLADRVMRAIAQRRPTRRPRLHRFVGPVALLAAACAALALHTQRSDRPSPALPASGDPAVAVRFALEAPRAREVALAGEWSGWRAQPLAQATSGDWSLTLPLPRGEWRYQFIVDGSWVDDPTAAAYLPDGFGGRNALLKL